MIEIGIKDGDLQVDPAKLVGSCGLVTGTRGSGKSYLVRVIVEQTIGAGLQTIILDPEGEFSTLRERCDLVIAGPEGDTPCEARSAKLLARRIAELGVSVVADMHRLRGDESFAFVADFLTALDRLPKNLERPRLVVLDEAHVFCPESGRGRAPRETRDAVALLMSQGRKRGLGAILVTQRLSKLSKDAAAEAGTIFVCCTSPIDLGRAQDVLGVTAQEREELRDLPTGWCYATGRALSARGVVKVHVRQATTTHPEPGERSLIAPPPPRGAIKRMLAELSTLPPAKEVEEAATLADAQKRIRELERELAKPREYAIDVAALERAAKTAAAERDTQWLKALDALRLNIDSDISSVAAYVDTLPQAKAEKRAHPANGKRYEAETRAAAPAPSPRAVKPAASGDGRAHTTGKERGFVGKAFDMLIALAQHGELTRRALAITSGMSVKGGSFARYLSAGRTLGYWTSEGTQIRITDAGRAAARECGAKPLPRGGRELVEHWCQHDALTGKARDMLRAVVAAGADGIDRDSLAGAIDMEGGGGSFARYLSTLRSLELVSGSKRLTAAPELRR